MNLVLNSTNVVPGSNNTRYTYKFISPTVLKEGSMMAVSNITLPNSMFNITTEYKNNVAAIEFPVGFSVQYFDLPLRNGYYTANDLNSLIQHTCQINGLYLIDGWGNFVYYLAITYDPILYAVRVTGYSIPTTLPTGWSTPSNWVGFPPSPYTPRFIVNTGFAKLIGFSTTTIGTITPYSVTSTQIPQGSVVNSIIVRANIIDNEAGFPTDILDTMPIVGSFGTNLNYTPPTLKWIRCTPGTFQSFDVFFSDQDFNPMYIIDPSVCISLLLKN